VLYKVKNLIIQTPKRDRFNQFTNKPGKDGTNGEDGEDGEDGDAGKHGVSVINTVQVDDKHFKFQFSDNTFSQAIALPIAKPGKDGEDGKNALPATPGKAGKSAPNIVAVKAFARKIVFIFSDGTELETPLKFPSGSANNPGIGFGSMEPPVKDIVGISPIKITDAGGIFTVSLVTKVVPVTEAYTALPSDDDLIVRGGTFTIDLFSETDATKDLSIMVVSGTITIDPKGSETINGDLTRILTTDQAIILVRDVGVGWRIK